MDTIAVYTETRIVPAKVSAFSFRNALQMLFFIAVWYGTGDTSALKRYYPLALDKLLSSSITLNEALLVFVLFAGMALLLSQCKLSIPRSRLHIPVIIFFVTFLLPYLRMTYDEGTFRIPYEIHDLTFFVAYLCVFLIFRAEEYKRLFVGLLIIALLKAIEGCIGYIIQPTAQSSWGALTEWRDGYLMGIALITWLVVITMKDDIPQKKVLQTTIGAMIILISFIISIRRSFIFALPFASIATVLTLRGSAKKKALFAVVGLFSIGLVLALFISPDRFFSRIEVVGNPLDEFSAAYRVFEYENVWMNVAASPWIGYPLGVPWKVYTTFPFPILSPLFAHDTYLNILLRSGFLGMALFSILVGAAVRSIRASLQNARTALERVCVSSFAGWGTLFIFGSVTAPMLTDFRASIVIGATTALIGLCDSALSHRAELAPEEAQ